MEERKHILRKMVTRANLDRFFTSPDDRSRWMIDDELTQEVLDGIPAQDLIGWAYPLADAIRTAADREERDYTDEEMQLFDHLNRASMAREDRLFARMSGEDSD